MRRVDRRSKSKFAHIFGSPTGTRLRRRLPIGAGTRLTSGKTWSLRPGRNGHDRNCGDATQNGTDLNVFPLCLGGNVFGWTVNEHEPASRCSTCSRRRAATSSTPPMSDTAWVPGHVGGESETIIGNWLTSRPRNCSQDGDCHEGRHGPRAEWPARGDRFGLRPRRRSHVCVSTGLTSTTRTRDDPDTPLEDSLRAFHGAGYRGQGAAHRGLQLHRAASGRSTRHLKTRRIGALCRAPAALQPGAPGTR